MATNKHATIRYQTLDKCFRNPGRRYYLDDLIEACNKSLHEFTGNDLGIKRRQILEDIKFMESPQGWNIPLDHCREGHKVYYRYSDKSFSINNQGLNETEENQLKEALQTLSRFKGMPQFEWVAEISARLDSGLGLSHCEDKIIEFDQNNYLKGLEHITPIYNSILYKRALKIEYKSFKQEDSQTINFHPYFLKQYNNRWYVFGKNDTSLFIMNLALDRIISINEIKKKFIPNETIDFNEYFEDIVGVTLENNGNIEHIVLRISNTLYPYIQTKPLHGSQKLKGNEKAHTLISLDLIPNYELESLILSYGEGVEVIEPKFLRDRIKNRIKAINKNYKIKSADKLHSKV
ncbi:MAG: WYL domain-containing protein [Chitinophagaceae bacterium]|nr:WYL domain-containing protein [Chitinophagaceae bacterium]